MGWFFCSLFILFLVRAVVLGDVYVELLVAGFVIWLCKPIFEYNLLLFLSQKLFDETLTTDDFNPIKALTVRQYLGLLLLKLSPRRTLVMAVTYLEGQTGQARKARLRVLTRGSNNALSLQFFVLVVIEFILVVGSWLFAVELFSFDVLGYDKANWIFEAKALPDWFLGWCFVAFILIESVLAVFFVASSFGLYVCRRSLLEGWDIELSFRELALRYQNSQKLQTPHLSADTRGEL